MKYLCKPKRCPEIVPGIYNFTIVASNVLHDTNQLQVAYKLGKEDDTGFRAYHLEMYTIDLSEGSEFRNLMGYIYYSIYPDSIVEVDTEGIIDAFGICNIINDDNGQTKIDIETMEFYGTMCGEIDLSQEDRDIYCNQ